MSLPAKHLFSTREWRRFAETGFFAPGYRAELIEGEIIDMLPIGPDHSSCVDWLHNYFNWKAPESIWVRGQNPVTLSDLSEPEPDVAIVKYYEHRYREAHPSPGDILLLIEVADSTLAYDRNTKAPLYARFSIPEYWIVNLPERCVEVYRDPRNGQYRDKQTLRGADVLRPLQVAEIAIEVSRIFW